MPIEHYPDNSYSAQKQTRDKVEPVIPEGSVAKKKKSIGSKFLGLFHVDGVENLGEYILCDVVFPEVYSAAHAIARAAIDGLFSGTKTKINNSTTSSSGIPVTRISYEDNYRQVHVGKTGSSSNTGVVRKPSDTMRYNDYVFISEQLAQDTLTGMLNIMEKYKCVRVSEFFDLIREPSEYTEERYGWYALGSAYITPCGADGYRLVLPRAVLLDK